MSAFFGQFRPNRPEGASERVLLLMALRLVLLPLARAVMACRRVLRE